MKNTFGNNLSVTLFGESHGTAVGAVLDGLPAGIPIDEARIARKMLLRKSLAEISTLRHEEDKVEIVSGVFDGKTTGTPLTVLICNRDVRSNDYEGLSDLARPGHADLSGFLKFGGWNDPNGGGHFSGRLTAPLVAAGAIASAILEEKKVQIGTHIARCAGISDRNFDDLPTDVDTLNRSAFAVLDQEQGEKMIAAIQRAKAEGDSVGGVLETVVVGLPAGVGEPWFDTLEGMLAHSLFSIPGVKGVEFGDGFALCDKKGSESNDAFFSRDGKLYTETDRQGGIYGGISVGLPIRLRVAVKPTPSIEKTQKTVRMPDLTETEISVGGRHDPAIVHRARAAVDACVALTLLDLLLTADCRNER